MLTVLFMYFLFDSGVPRRLPVALCDQDNTKLSRSVERAIDATPSARISFHVASPEEGKQLIIDRKVYALILIPRHFQRDVERGLSPAIVNWYNNVFLYVGESCKARTIRGYGV
jgi:ABC-2 type transport system permease protein